MVISYFVHINILNLLWVLYEIVFGACHGVLEERLGYNHLKLCMRFKRHHNSYTYIHTLHTYNRKVLLANERGILGFQVNSSFALLLFAYIQSFRTSSTPLQPFDYPSRYNPVNGAAGAGVRSQWNENSRQMPSQQYCMAPKAASIAPATPEPNSVCYSFPNAKSEIYLSSCVVLIYNLFVQIH